jgi:hypothetical protein
VTEPLEDHEQPAGVGDDAEVVDALPVPDDVPGREPPPPPAPVPQRASGLMLANPVAVQAAAVAMTGFAAGAATVAVVRRRRARKALRGRRKDRKLIGDVRASRSFLVDIHLLDRG